ADGHMLAISMQTNDPSSSVNTQDDGFFLASFADVSAPFATVRGTVWHDTNGDGLQTTDEIASSISEVSVTLFDETGSQIGTTTTATDGTYQFNISSGVPYHLQFVAPGYSFSPEHVGSDRTIDSDADPANGQTGKIILAAGQVDDTWDVGLVPIATFTPSST